MALNIRYDRILDDLREADSTGGAALPAAGDFTFQLFFNTSDTTLYVWTGSAWVAIGSGTPVSHVGESMGLLLSLTYAT